MGYSDKQKELVLAILEGNKAANADDLYAVLRPRRSTIGKWKESNDKTSIGKMRKLINAIKNRPSLVLWIIFEGFLTFSIVAISITSLELAIILVDSFAPQQGDMERMNAILVSAKSYFWLELLLAIAIAVFSIMFNISGREKRWMKNAGIGLTVLLIAVLLGNVITTLVDIANEANMFLLSAAAIFCCTVVFVCLLYANGYSRGAEHDGYEQSLRLITILSLVIAILLALFGLVEGNGFSDKADWLRCVLRS